MKKFLVPFLCYSIFASLVIFCFGIFYLPVPLVPKSAEFTYRISNGLVLLTGIVPSICFTGFLLGCTLSFGEACKRSRENLRMEIYSLFKKVMLLAIAITLVISLCSLVFLPYERLKQQGMRNLPVALNEYIRLTKHYLNTEYPEQASKYIQRAKELEPGNEEIEMLARRVEFKIKENESVRSKEKVISYVQTDFNAQKKLPMLFNESEMNVVDMIEMSRSCFAERNFFDAHYFAEGALRLSKEGDANYDVARNLADESWRELQSAQMELSTEGNMFFRKKLSGYKSLMSGNVVDAYYIFHGLSQEDARKERDPDVVRYLELSRNMLLETYFFIDETDDLMAFESAKNIYFTVPQEQGNYDIVLIRAITDVAGADSLVRYLRDLRIYSFDSNGKLLRLVQTPYAKMCAMQTSDLDEDTRRKIASVVPSAKIVPQIMLCSLGRDSDTEKNIPQYYFPDNIKNKISGDKDKPNKIYWPMPYDAFSVIINSFFGSYLINPFGKNGLGSSAVNYGFSAEVFSFNVLNKFFYPFMILLFLVFIAIFAWNYRLASGAIFKFKWIFILPILNVAFYFTCRAIEYFMHMVNFVFIVMVGARVSFFAGLGFYIVFLGVMVSIFLTRKAD
ncbi:MAG: hypothetical protein K2N58_01070 [Treponemataceae bacterium]|nr:hypothetical protein [Treponemataceae bacterium]